MKYLTKVKSILLDINRTIKCFLLNHEIRFQVQIINSLEGKQLSVLFY